ncbi:hypothetical protein C7964_102724 [Loktanella sp. PT4BL]|uniref:hypothetical protein n=1 Tax=Loktanella sp. PT4BL TaxID=2135611 RepID=UPI000D838957|nr:hypothetical protein [Loktanella sp. PT4BL]PXW70825.1 hypothetical protein C7964_102724 [Loktanella sp. PT4BL]
MRKTLSALHPYWLWALFALPAVLMSYEALTSDDPRVFHILVHPTGEFSARFLIVTLMATPLAMLLKGGAGRSGSKRTAAIWVLLPSVTRSCTPCST